MEDLLIPQESPEGFVVAENVPASDVAAEPTPPIEAPKAEVSEEHVADYIGKRSHDELKKIPAYNTTLQKLAAEQRASITKQVQEETAARVAEVQRFEQWKVWFAQLESQPVQFAAYMKDPQYRRMYDWVQSYQGPVENTIGKLGAAAVEKLRNELSARPEFAGLDWDDVTSDPDLGSAFVKLINKGVEKERKAMHDGVKAEVSAQVASALAKAGLKAEEPERVPGDVAGTGSDEAFMKQYAAGDSDDHKRAAAILARLR